MSLKEQLFEHCMDVGIDPESGQAKQLVDWTISSIQYTLINQVKSLTDEKIEELSEKKYPSIDGDTRSVWVEEGMRLARQYYLNNKP